MKNLIFFLINLFIISSCDLNGKESSNNDPESSKSKGFKKEIDHEKLSYIEGIPIIYISESGFAGGLQHGTLLSKEVNEMVDILHNEVLKTNTLTGSKNYAYLLERCLELNAYIPENYQAEMKGIAEGAKVKWEDILLINTYDDVIKMSKCSSMSAVKTKSNSIFFHARNLDYSILSMAGKTIVIHYLETQSTLVSFPGFIGGITGTNLHGITLTSHTSDVNQSAKGIPTGILYRKIIDSAKSIDEVETILKNSKRTIGNNILVSSANENTSVVFEFTSKDLVKRTNEKYVIATNHFVDEQLSGLYHNLWNGSVMRYNFLEQFLKNKDISIETIKAAMSDTGVKSGKWSCVANECTVQSVLFLPNEHIIYIAKGKNAPVTNDGYVEYNYSSIVE